MYITKKYWALALFSLCALALPVGGNATVGQSGAGSKVGSGSIIDRSNQNNEEYYRPVGEGTSVRTGNTGRTQYRNYQDLRNENTHFRNQSTMRNQNYDVNSK